MGVERHFRHFAADPGFEASGGCRFSRFLVQNLILNSRLEAGRTGREMAENERRRDRVWKRPGKNGVSHPWPLVVILDIHVDTRGLCSYDKCLACKVNPGIVVGQTKLPIRNQPLNEQMRASRSIRSYGVHICIRLCAQPVALCSSLGKS